MSTIRLSQQDLQNLETSLKREYLETNGLGGYASATVVGVRTRKYHGLLVAPTHPPVGRHLLAADLEEAVIVQGKRIPLSTHQYIDTIYPEGFRYLREFRLDPFPVFVYDIEGLLLEKTIFMCYGENTTCILYRIRRLPKGIRHGQILLEVRPLLAMRSHHDLVREDPQYDLRFDAQPASVTFELDGKPPLTMMFAGARFEHQPHWYGNFFYPREAESGYQAVEDLYSPGRLIFTFDFASSASLAFTTESAWKMDFEARRTAEIERRNALRANLPGDDDLISALVVAADAFIVRRHPDGRSIIAGYPWFTDWGRDAMISLPGLCLVTRRFEDARNIIATFVGSMKDGLIPNHFGESPGETLYNTIDATLWLFEAIWRYYDATGDGDFVCEILPQLRDSVRHHLEGTHYGIHVDEDGLLMGGCEGVQLTWMDAKVGDKVITARMGKPVEINALWYNALKIMAAFAANFGGLAEEAKYDDLARCAYQAFNEVFWNAEGGYLYDNISSEGPDPSLRPNQIFAISLSFPVLEPERWRPVVDKVSKHLLTPYGLRTLSPDHPNYRGQYRGDLVARDHAYHQGTVWPWLLGHYLVAYVKTYGTSPATISRTIEQLEPLRDHLRWAGLGSISEIFDGDPPHEPNGCIAQAWSVAEVLRALVEIAHSGSRSEVSTRK